MGRIFLSDWIEGEWFGRRGEERAKERNGGRGAERSGKRKGRGEEW